MLRKNGHTFIEDDSAAAALSAELSSLLRFLLSENGYTQSGFARAVGLSRVTLNQVLKSTDGKYLWRLPLLCAAARVLGTTVSKFVSAAEARLHGDMEPSVQLAMSMKHVPVSSDVDERLRAQIVYVLNTFSFFPGAPKDAAFMREDFEAAYRCSPAEIKAGVPEFYKLYSEGKLSDKDIFPFLWKAANYSLDHGGLDAIPFWISLKEVFKV